MHEQLLTQLAFLDTLGMHTAVLLADQYSLHIYRPPHQIMAWVGLERYGYLEDAQRLAYRFLYMYVPSILWLTHEAHRVESG